MTITILFLFIRSCGICLNFYFTFFTLVNKPIAGVTQYIPSVIVGKQEENIGISH